MLINRQYLIVASIIAVFVAGLRVAFFDQVGSHMDTTFLVLLLFAFFIPIVPWEKLSTFKAAGIELVLEQQQVQSAIQGLGLDRLADQKLRDSLTRLGNDLQLVQGSRILWIDDRPHKIVGQRRLFRALGAEVVTAISSDDAEKILESDNDFDLIISDVQRHGDNYQQVEGGKQIHEGVNFIVVLRKHPDPVIQALPVVFYAAYPWERLVMFTEPARKVSENMEICNAIDGLISKAIRLLSESRTNPIVIEESKVPTTARPIPKET